MDVKTYYLEKLSEKGYSADSAQQQAIDRLQVLFDDWIQFKKVRSNRLKRWLRKPIAPRGVYLWGGVGRGKSFLMDSFYESVPVVRKVRLHFHEFMKGVHKALDQTTGKKDPLNVVARRIAKKYRLICFDEFHISDIADAMILYRLLEALIAHNVSFVMTSNYEPNTLYPDGLHRDRLLPAIALIQSRMDILNVDAGIDYRQRDLEQIQTYHIPHDTLAEQKLSAVFQHYAGHSVVTTEPVYVENRLVPIIKRAQDVIWFDFATLCEGARSQNDYLALIQSFSVFIVSDVPKMTASQASAARRFTWLVDILYDHKIKLFMSAACSMIELYTEGTLANEFFRTVSRLEEMQSKEYLEAPARQSASFEGLGHQQEIINKSE